MTYVYDFPKPQIACVGQGLDEAAAIGREIDQALRATLGVRAEGFVTVGHPTPRYEDDNKTTAEPRDMRPSLIEASAVFHAVEAYRQAQGLPGAHMADLPLHLEELKNSIAKVEWVTDRGERL
jgi:hypothetical protein